MAKIPIETAQYRYPGLFIALKRIVETRNNNIMVYHKIVVINTVLIRFLVTLVTKKRENESTCRYLGLSFPRYLALEYCSQQSKTISNIVIDQNVPRSYT